MSGTKRNVKEEAKVNVVPEVDTNDVTTDDAVQTETKPEYRRTFWGSVCHGFNKGRKGLWRFAKHSGTFIGGIVLGAAGTFIYLDQQTRKTGYYNEPTDKELSDMISDIIDGEGTIKSTEEE